MSKYCVNCGAEVKVGKPFCGDCGAKTDSEAEQKTEEGKVQEQASKKKTKLIILAAAGLVLIGLITALGMIFGSADNDYEKPVRNWINAYETNDFEKYINSYVTDNIGQTVENFRINHKQMEDEYGEDFKGEYKIKAKKELTKEQLDYIEDNFNLVLSKGYSLDTEITYKGSKSERTITQNFTVVKHIGKWYLCNIDVKYIPLNTPKPDNTVLDIEDEIGIKDTNDYVKPLINMIKGINSKDYDLFICSFAPSEQTVIKSKYMNLGLDKDAYMEALSESIKNNYGNEQIKNCTNFNVDKCSVNELGMQQYENLTSEIYILDFYLNNQSSGSSKVFVKIAKLDGTWCILSLPTFLNVNIKKTEPIEYDYLFQAMIKALVNKDFSNIGKIFVNGYFNSSDNKDELLGKIFNPNNLSENVKFSYKINSKKLLSLGKRESYKNKYSLSSVPSEGYSLEIEWKATSDTAQKSNKINAEVIKLGESWYFAELNNLIVVRN